MPCAIRPHNDEDALRQAADILQAGGVVGVPTETVYGLAGRADLPEGVARIYQTKGRPQFNPLIAHVDSLERARALIVFSPMMVRLADAFWPGPLTLVGPKRDDAQVCDLVTAGLDTLAVRWPRSSAICALVKALDCPLAAPSANPSGTISPTTAQHVGEGFGDALALVLDGGTCPVGLESTILAVEGDEVTLLRPGGLDRAQIEAITGPLKAAGEGGAPRAPGMLKSHYAPSVAMRLNAQHPRPGEAYLAFGQSPDNFTGPMINLSPTQNLVEAASTLFASLKALDRHGLTISVAPIPFDGLGEAINDRLIRAAAPKEIL